MFTDVEFMTTKEKELVLKNWKRFIEDGLQRRHFTKRLYEHLHLHSGFVANFNVGGFYSVYFEAGQDIERFFEHFCNYKVLDDYSDINTAMREVYNKHKDAIKAQIENDITDRLNLLEVCVKRAKTDMEYAKRFLRKVRTEHTMKIAKVYDNQGKSFDRYTLLFEGRPDALGLSHNCESPQGFSQFGVAIEGRHLGREIPFKDLPQNVRLHVLQRTM